MQARRALESFILQKKLSPRKLRNLVFVAMTAERLASKPYMEKGDLEGIVERFGVLPDVTTWGDFFAAEIASDHWEKSESEFERICETVGFDFIAASLIFSEKPGAFLAGVLADYEFSMTKEIGLRSPGDLEKIHLGILAGYFTQMGLNKSLLAAADIEFFDSFSVKTKSA